MALVLALLVLGIWIYLIAARGGFWRAAQRDDELETLKVEPATWPAVAAIIPARNEAAMLPESLASLLAQDYPGTFSVVLVDDQSGDGTAEIARAVARRSGRPERFFVFSGREVPAGWTGKLWAMQQGLDFIDAKAGAAEFVLFTDADIAYAPGQLRRLVEGAEARRAVLTSCMAKLQAESAAERWLVPAFVFFFQKLYPFAWVADPSAKTAAAAGGCMLIRRRSLIRAGGLPAIREALIDDCAMGAIMKAQGPVWLGLSDCVVSLRPYPRFDDIRRMVVRSAYAQLHYSPLQLAGAVAGMVLTYLTAPLIALMADDWARLPALAAWLLMMMSFVPILRFYRLSPLRALALPAIAAVYTAFTLESAFRHLRGQGGEWKGRYQADLSRGVPGP